MPDVKTYTVRVRIREITYMGKTTNIIGQEVIEAQVAYGPGRPEIDPVSVLGPDVDVESDEYKAAADNFRLGQKVDLLPNDYLRYKNSPFKAIVDEDEVVALDEGEILDAAYASTDDLADWIRDEKPTVNEVVSASEGSPDLANKLLEAESAAHDGEPRKGVVDGLAAVIARG